MHALNTNITNQSILYNYNICKDKFENNIISIKFIDHINTYIKSNTYISHNIHICILYMFKRIRYKHLE
jgi:hypothetical protein